MNGCSYQSGEMVQFSFEYKSHQNLAVNSVAATSNVLDDTTAILSMTVGAHVRINGLADTSSMVLPAGVWTIKVPPNSTISVLKLTGSVDGQASVIIPR